MPVNEILEREGCYESTGVDPQFELVTNRKSLPRRWVFISYKTTDPDKILAPSLFYSKGDGYRENDVINLSDKTPEKSCLVRLPYNLKSLRLDPAQVPGQFNIADVNCIEVGFIPLLLILSWREIDHDLKSPGVLITKVLKGLGYILTKGPIRARERLITKHQGWVQKRVFHNYKQAKPPAAPEESLWQDLIEKGKSGHAYNRAARVDVIVPVYKGYDETLNCIYRVLTESNSTGFNLIVINDNSPDQHLSSKLRELSEKGLFSLHENKDNLGFVRTINSGMRLNTDNDVVLLNSDTEVYSNWLDRLHSTAYSKKNIGTVTPFSNNAEICSYPYNTQDNSMQLELSYSELDAIASESNAGKCVEVPTGIGFCMYIRRECLNDVGYFDEENFGKGYGEENDFCLRAEKRGWTHVLSADTFVRHVGGSSFGSEKQERVINAIRVMNDLHPGYDRRIQEYLYEDPVSVLRKNIDIGRLKRQAGNKVFLFISHNWGGGVEKYNQEMTKLLQQEGVQIYYLRPNPHNNLVAEFSCPGTAYLPNLPVLDILNGAERNAVVLREYGITHVHVHSLAGFNERLLTILPEMIRLAGLRYDVTLHDYLTICPRIHLCDNKGQYCGEPHDKICNACIRGYGSPFGKVDIKSWKDRNRDILRSARMVYVPNEDVTGRMVHHYPEVGYTLRPHPEEPNDGSRMIRAVRRPGERVRVGIIGAIGPQKGSTLLLRCAQDAQERHLPLEYVVIGYTNIPELANEPIVTVTGEYKESEIYDLIRENHIHILFFPATAPETYSYTFSIALRTGIMPIAFDIGAVSNRMRKMGYGRQLIPIEHSDSPEFTNNFLMDSYAQNLDTVHSSCEFAQYRSLLNDYYLLYEDEERFLQETISL